MRVGLALRTPKARIFAFDINDSRARFRGPGARRRAAYFFPTISWSRGRDARATCFSRKSLTCRQEWARYMPTPCSTEGGTPCLRSQQCWHPRTRPRLLDRSEAVEPTRPVQRQAHQLSRDPRSTARRVSTCAIQLLGGRSFSGFDQPPLGLTASCNCGGRARERYTAAWASKAPAVSAFGQGRSGRASGRRETRRRRHRRWH